MGDFDTALQEINTLSILVRVLLSLAIGGVLGIERGRKNRPAGFRTYMLVCLGAALVMMTNQYVFERMGVSDPVRMGSQVVSGIGFLGAGTILVTGKNQVRGITTAAGLWTAACCGLAVGIGFYSAAIIGGLSILLVMEVMVKLDVFIRRNTRWMEVYIELDGNTHFSRFITHARTCGFDVFDIQMQKNKTTPDGVMGVVMTVDSGRRMLHSEMLEQLSTAPGVQYIEELQ